MSPLRGLGLGGPIFLQRYHPYGIQEVFEVFKVSASYPVSVGKPNLPDLDTRAVIFSKIDTYGANSDSPYL